MMPDQKTRLLIGTLVAAVIIVVGYGVFRELGRPSETVSRPVTPVAAPAPVQEEAPRPGPVSIQAEGSAVANTSGHEASVTGEPDMSYEWSIRGGTIQGVTTGTSIMWTAGPGPEAVLICKGTDPKGRASTAVLQVVLLQPPAITLFEALPPVITKGSGTKLRWTVSNNEKLSLDPGGQDLSKYAGPLLEVKPEETLTYTLTATGSSGVAVTRELQVKVVPPPQITALRAEPLSGSSTSFTVIGEFKNGKAELKNGEETIAASETSPLRIQLTDLKEGSSLSLKVTNEAGSSVTSRLNFTMKKQ